MGTLTDEEKVDVRRHCGYPAFGGQPVQAFGHRFFQHYGTLEFRIENMSAAEEAVLRSYLVRLNQLESDLAGVRENLDTASAAVWTRNPNEHADRERLYRTWVNKLLAFIGVPPGPGQRSSNVIEVIV